MAEEQEEEEEEGEEVEGGSAVCRWIACSECLERRIQSDFSGDLVFRHGVSDSALPFGCAAVVEMNVTTRGEESKSDEVAAQFLLVVLSNQEEALSDARYSLSDSTGDPLSGSERMPSSENSHHQHEANIGVLDDDQMHSSDWKTRFIPGIKDTSSLQRLITVLSPGVHIDSGSYSTLQELARNYLSGSTEDHVMSSINLLLEREASGRYDVDFFSSIGLPFFMEKDVPGCVRHPNVAPVLGMLRTSSCTYLLQPKTPYTLETVLNYSPRVLQSDWDIRFLIYQLLSALSYIHSLGVAHGNICPSSIMLTDSLWSWLNLCDGKDRTLGLKEDSISSRVCFCMKNCPCQAIYADLKLSSPIDWGCDFKRWWMGELSNYEYLLILNKLAGRSCGDHTFHTVMPWVIDFSVKPDEESDVGWRDLQKSKWRLAKGDEQLDFTYSTSEVPHHVSDECLSELAVCSYKARRLPLSILRSAVRSVYEPNEYPSNMQRLYQWTPDECIPEFYCDPRIFYSIHSGMSDLRVPSWAKSPEDFILLHRAALESDRVSRQIHHWIDITFGYKLFGEASIAAKNVMLPTADPMMPKSIGRRQLFTRPHPMRQCSWKKSHHDLKEQHMNYLAPGNGNHMGLNENRNVTISPEEGCLLPETCVLQALEESVSFAADACVLSPIYNFSEKLMEESFIRRPSDENVLRVDVGSHSLTARNVDLSCLLESFGADENGFIGFRDLLSFKQQLSDSTVLSEHVAGDIFSVGCIIAELYLKRALFDSVSLSIYLEKDILPRVIWELPAHVRILVESCILKDWRRRPSAKSILESQYFPPTVRSVYHFVAPIQTLSKSVSGLQYASKLAKEGALKAMGPFAAEMCAPYCFSLISNSLSDAESEASLSLLTEFVRCLKLPAIKSLILPTIQKILQLAGSLHLKISLLQDSFVRKVWKHLGKQAYLEKLHPLVISNLCNCPNRVTASAASVLLIGSSEELGLPVTIHQTILPLIHCFGRGLSVDGIDALVRIGGLLGEDFITRHLLPLLRNVVLSCLEASSVNKSETVQSWNSLVLIDCFTTLDGLVKLLQKDMVLKELILDHVCLHIKVLSRTNLDLSVFQVVATTLVSVCQRIGPESTAAHVLPQLKGLFDELAFSQEAVDSSSSRRNSSSSVAKLDREILIESRLDLVLLLYPSFASLIGIERLRQCCATWFLLEQFLERSHGWKWGLTEEASRSSSVENTSLQRGTFSTISSIDYNPAKLLLNGVGWSIPQSQGARGGKSLMYYKHLDDQRATLEKDKVNSGLDRHHPWFWFPRTATSWDVVDYLGRAGGLKDDPWRIKASILYSTRAHPGALRSLAVSHDECTVFTGGVGPAFKGTVQKWELPRMNCVYAYYGHDEVVNDITILSMSERIASCDGTIHVWSSLTGKLITAFAESSTITSQHSSTLLPSKVNADPPTHVPPSSSSSGIYSNAFSGSMYTCMHHLDSDDKLVAGMGSGCIRFIDVAEGKKLHLWRTDTAEHYLSSIVSAICSCGSSELQAERSPCAPRWIAAGLSSGHCRLLDARSGEIVALWRAHDGYITRLASPEDHMLVSSSLDRTLRIWDLRRDLSIQSNIFTGHSDGISSFAMWGQNIISISKNKIGLSSFSRSTSDRGQKHIAPQRLYSADRGARNMSVLTTISILPFSRLFLIGTEEGHLKVCC